MADSAFLVRYVFELTAGALRLAQPLPAWVAHGFCQNPIDMRSHLDLAPDEASDQPKAHDEPVRWAGHHLRLQGL